MLRLAWKTLATLTLLGLLYIVGHAAAGVTGPRSALRQAEAAYNQQLYSEAIALLDIAIKDLDKGAPAALREEILALRGQTYLKIKNLALATKDFQIIHSLNPDDSTQAATLIHTIISDQHPEAALKVAGKFLGAHPGDMRIQELSGEAEQMIYQSRIRHLREQFQLELGPQRLNEAIEAIRPWFYRDANDPEALLSRKTLDEVLRIASPRAYAARRFDAPMAAIRSSVGRAMQFYWTAFELGGMPVAAYQGLSYALEQGGRLDDLQALAEIYMLRFHDWRTVEAAIDLTELHLKNYRYRATVDASDRYLPPGTWQNRGLSNSVRHVLNAKSAALFGLGAYDELSKLAVETSRMQDSGGMNLLPESLFIQLRDREAAGKKGQANQLINQLRKTLPNRPNTEQLKEELRIVLRRQFANAIKYQQKRQTFDWIFRSWLSIDSSQPEVHLARAQYFGEVGDYPEMLASAQRALDLNSHDEESLKAYARAADTFYHQSSRGSQDLLPRALELEQLIPEDLTSDYLLMPLAERAMQQGHYEIAEACASEAARVFNWAKWPKYLLVDAHLALGEADQAMQAATALLAFYPEDGKGIRLLQKARRMAGASTDDLLFRLLLIGEHDAGIARSLLGFASRHADIALEAGIARNLLEMAPGDLRALDRIAMLEYAQGDLEAARETLGGIVAATPEDGGRDAAFALSREFLMTMLAGQNADLDDRFESLLAACSTQPDLATDLAADLTILGHPKLATSLLDPILLEERYAKVRSGRHFLLAADVAIEDGRNFEAIAHLRSARSFEDGLGASKKIAILQVRLGNFASALAELGEGPATDLLSACLAARLGRVATASDWVEPWFAANPLDFKARLLRAILNPAAESSPLIRPLIDRAPMQILQLLTLLTTDGFKTDAMAIAGSLLRASPLDPLSLYLYAEAQAKSGSGQRALITLSQLIAKRPDFTPAYYRILQLLPRAVDQDRLALRLLTTGDHRPRSIFPARDFRKLLTLIPANIIETIADDWIASAGHSDLGVDEVAFLQKMNQVEKALQLSEALAIAGGDKDPELWRNYFRLATKALKEGKLSDSLNNARQRAIENIAREIEIDSAVDFLLQLDLATLGPLGDRQSAPRVDKLQSWIKAHLQSAQHGITSDAEHLTRSLKTLAKLSGRPHALEQIDKLLTADPSLIEVWLLRTRWLSEDGHLAAGLRGLRGILDFLPDNPAQLTVAELAAERANVDLRPIRDVVEHLPPELCDTPDGRLSRGLLALRGADYQLADELLTDCATRPDGSPIYYRALANLSLTRTDKARRLFLQLAADYPESPLSINALHFAKQLAK